MHVRISSRKKQRQQQKEHGHKNEFVNAIPNATIERGGDREKVPHVHMCIIEVLKRRSMATARDNDDADADDRNRERKPKHRSIASFKWKTELVLLD